MYIRMQREGCDMEKQQNSDIIKLQKYLPIIRNAGGWSSDEFAKKLGISRQALSKLENSPTYNMSQTNYMAIRTLLDYEINNNPDNELLQAVVNICLDDEELKVPKDRITDDDRRSVNAFITGAKKTGLDNKVVLAGIAAMLGVGAGILVAPAATAWIVKLLDKNK